MSSSASFVYSSVKHLLKASCKTVWVWARVVLKMLLNSPQIPFDYQRTKLLQCFTSLHSSILSPLLYPIHTKSDTTKITVTSQSMFHFLKCSFQLHGWYINWQALALPHGGGCKEPRLSGILLGQRSDLCSPWELIILCICFANSLVLIIQCYHSEDTQQYAPLIHNKFKGKHFISWFLVD